MLFGALAANLGVAAAVRLAMAAGLIIALTLVVFFAGTFPAKLATESWTRMPSGGEKPRRCWECSHALNAGLGFLALRAVVLSVMPDDAGEGGNDRP